MLREIRIGFQSAAGACNLTLGLDDAETVQADILASLSQCSTFPLRQCLPPDGGMLRSRRT